MKRLAIVLLVAILSQATGNVLLSKGMKNLSGPSDAISIRNAGQILVKALESPTIWLGTILLAVFFLLYSTALSWADLSYVLPATSFGYVVNVLFAHHFLQEPVSLLKWCGTFLIASGVILVSKTVKQNRENHPLPGTASVKEPI